MINDPKEIKEVLNAIDKIKKEDLDKAIEAVDNKLSEEEIINRLIKTQKYSLVEIIRKFKREGIENFIIIRLELIQRIIRPIPKGKREKYGIRTRKHRIKGRKKISSRRDTRTILCEQR